eukprot:14737567-Heterocapsa_arctica.AAC.1
MEWHHPEHHNPDYKLSDRVRQMLHNSSEEAKAYFSQMGPIGNKVWSVDELLVSIVKKARTDIGEREDWSVTGGASESNNVNQEQLGH